MIKLVSWKAANFWTISYMGSGNQFCLKKCRERTQNKNKKWLTEINLASPGILYMDDKLYGIYRMCKIF